MPIEWKDATQEVPPKDAYEMALVVARDVYGDPYLTFGWYDHYQQMWRGRYGRLTGVSHWMDLPAPPQGVTYRHIGEPKR